MIPFNHLGPIFKLFSGGIYSAPVRRELHALLEDLPSGARVLDLGAGTATLSTLARERRPDLVYLAIDEAPGMLRYAPSHFLRTAGTAERLPLRDASLSAVVMGEAIHHFENPDGALDEIARVMEPGGRLFIFDFDPSTWLGGFICRAERLLGEPGNFYPPADLCRMLEQRGFECRIGESGWRYVIRARRVTAEE